MHHGPQDHIYKALLDLGAPSIDVGRWAIKAQDNWIELAKDTVAINPAPPKLANLNQNKLTYKVVSLVKGWVHHLNQGFWLSREAK